MPTERVEFAGSQGATLAGRLDTPEQPPHVWALFAHCFTCSKDSKGAAVIARELARAGIGVLRFDFTGLGDSGGDFAHTHFSSNVDDLLCAADWLRRYRQAPSLLVGHSLGGAAVLACASQVPESRAVATLGAPFDPAHVLGQFGPSVELIERQGQAQLTLAGRPFTVRREFLDDVAGQPQARRIRALGRPLLVMHAPDDAIVGIDSARRIFEAALHPKSFVALDGSTHLLDRRDDAEWAAAMLAAWSSRYLPPRQADAG